MELGVFPDRTCEDGYPDELGQGVHGHLRHHVRAVDLDGLRAQSEIGSDLLVGLAGGHQREDLPLTRRERLEPAPRFLASPAHLALQAVDLERLPDAIEEQLIAERLLDEVAP